MRSRTGAGKGGQKAVLFRLWERQFDVCLVWHLRTITHGIVLCKGSAELRRWRCSCKRIFHSGLKLFSKRLFSRERLRQMRLTGVHPGLKRDHRMWGCFGHVCSIPNRGRLLYAVFCVLSRSDPCEDRFLNNTC